MKKKKLAFWLFFGTFTLLLLAGLGLTVFSVATIPNQGASILEWSMEGQKVSFKLTTGIPGLIITAFGFLGLLNLSRCRLKHPWRSCTTGVISIFLVQA